MIESYGENMLSIEKITTRHKAAPVTDEQSLALGSRPRAYKPIGTSDTQQKAFELIKGELENLTFALVVRCLIFSFSIKFTKFSRKDSLLRW